MTGEKPKNITEYKKWLYDKHSVEVSDRLESYYKATSARIKTDFEGSDFWVQLTRAFREYHDEYSVNTGYPLLLMRESQPIVLTKPFDSFLLKTFRKNVVANKSWPKEPQGGWILPTNWYSKINDTVRTLIEVKYLDGVEYLIEKIKVFSEREHTECRSFLEARDEGYYAAHLYIKRNFEIPRVTWDTERVDVSIEIQITTQLQEVIRKLLHSYYENAREKTKDADDVKWQWNYRSEEFSANYLGHILHYVEGMIMEIRDKQRDKEKLP